MSQLNTNIIKGVQDNDDVVIKTNNTTRVTIASGGDVSLPTTTCTTLSAPSVSAVNTAKAWIHFNGESTISIVTAYNVSSIADNGTGDYTLTFATAFPNANYCVIGGAHRKSGDSQIRKFGTYDATAMATGSCRINSQYSGGNSADSNRVQVLIFSD